MRKLLGVVRLGEAGVYGGLAVVPLFAALKGPAYVTLDEALAAGTLVVGELGEGAVPALVAENRGDTAVLVLDGEELVGAKQNRIANTAVLIAAGARIILPVSCVESGRWHDVAPEMMVSRDMAAHSVRSVARESVDMALRSGGSYRSDQGAVWEAVADLHDRAHVDSETDAMHAAFDTYEEELAEYREHFPLVEGQNGVLVLYRGRVAGMEVVSRTEVYAHLHRKLIDSYSMEAVVDGADGAFEPAVLAAFTEKLQSLSGEEFPTPGMGRAMRYSCDGLLGSALVVRGTPVHVAFFVSETIGGSGRGPCVRRQSAPRSRTATAPIASVAAATCQEGSANAKNDRAKGTARIAPRATAMPARRATFQGASGRSRISMILSP